MSLFHFFSILISVIKNFHIILQLMGKFLSVIMRIERIVLTFIIKIPLAKAPLKRSRKRNHFILKSANRNEKNC